MSKYINVLRDWNFWERQVDSGVRRKKYVDRLMNTVDLREVVAVSGVRRCGKSTILLQIIEELHRKKGVPRENILYVNFEDPRLGDVLKANDLFNLVDEYRFHLKPRGRVFIFFDEVHKVDQWEKYVRSVYDRKKTVKFFVSGSSSRIFDTSLSTVLSGRLLNFLIKPLDFKEFLGFKKMIGKISKHKELFDEYLHFGGFPQVVLEKNPLHKRAILVSYYETILEKDILLKNNIKNKLEVKQLARYVITNVGNQISSYALEKSLGISNTNIQKYLQYFEEAYIISRVSMFSYSVKKQIYNPQKVFCVDTGLSNVVGFKFSENKGRLLENVVFHKLNNMYGDVYYWKNGTEVDFLIFEKAEVKSLINVTQTVDDADVLKREMVSLSLGKKEFPESDFKLITLYNESKQTAREIESLLEFVVG